MGGPFGEEVSTTGPTAASSISYSDEVHDPETGLDTYQYRSYNPKLGRWMSPDPSSLHFSRLTNSQTFNLYAFVTNDPLKYTDAYGLFRCYECGDGGDDGDDGFDDEFGGGGGGGGGYQFDDGSDDGGGYNGADPGADAGSNTCPVDACVTADPDPPVPTTPSDPTNTTVDDSCDPNFCVNVNAGPDPTLPIDPGSPYDPTVPYQPPPDPPSIETTLPFDPPPNAQPLPCLVGNCSWTISFQVPPSYVVPNVCPTIHGTNGQPAQFISVGACVGNMNQCGLSTNINVFDNSCSATGGTTFGCGGASNLYTGGSVYTCTCCKLP